MEENRPLYNRLEDNLQKESNYTKEDIKGWRRKWKKFHKSLPNRIVLGCEFIFYKHRDNTFFKNILSQNSSVDPSLPDS